VSIFSKAKKLVRKVETKVGLRDEKRRPGPAVDPDPINPLTGRPVSQNVPQDPMGQPLQGLGQMQAAYLPPPVSMAQRVPNGLGSDVFRSTLGPLQQQGYGLGQIDPRLLTSTVRFPGGSTFPQQPPTQMPAQMPTQNQTQQQFPAQFGLGMQRMFM
jgi:hypothetical protein